MAIICGSCKDRHASVLEVQDCYAQFAEWEAEGRAEQYAEAISSWCSGGGSYQDAKTYAHVTVTLGLDWNAYLTQGDPEDDGSLCEHQLSLALCCGPQHYPLDNYFD